MDRMEQLGEIGCCMSASHELCMLVLFSPPEHKPDKMVNIRQGSLL